jgi:hypothetical protein
LDDDKAFDAVESYLCETEREPSGQWRTVSLVTAMLGIIAHGPEFQKPTPEARHEAFKAAADELSRRGLDAVALVRYGMSREATAPLVAAIIVRLLFEGNPSIKRVEVVFDRKPSIDGVKVNPPVDIEGVDVDSWFAVLDLEPGPARGKYGPTPETTARIEQVLSSVLPRVDQWEASASIDDIVNLTPPTREALASLPNGEPLDRNLREQYRWAVDHFAKTFFRDWKTSSLHYELRWLDGDIVPPCPNELMLDRRVPREEITQEIARRTVYEDDSPDPVESLVVEMSRHAIKLLRQGRCREAAAVFEFGVQQRPEDPDVRNNLGFCLIPIEPRQALEHLKAAANMGYQPSVTNAYNQMCCYVSIGRSRAALNVADFESKKFDRTSMGAHLWRQSSDGDWELFDSEDIFKSIAGFAARIARMEGWKDQEEHWIAAESGRVDLPEESQQADN